VSILINQEDDLMDFINSSEYCSGGLRALLEQRGTSDGKFELPIEEGPIFNIVRSLTNAPCILHIGCSTDERNPSFVIRERRGWLGANLFEFRFERMIPTDVVHNNNWFHDNNRQRNLDQMAAALNAWKQCEETVRFVCSTHERNMGSTANVVLFFSQGRLQKIWDLDRLQTEPFSSKLVGFNGSILENLALKIEQESKATDRYLEPEDWNRILIQQNLTISDLIKQFYQLFLRSSANLPEPEHYARF